jgi:hypothetical protein
LTGVLVSVAATGFDRPTAGLWWPADRAWFVATELDLDWTFVAGGTQLVERLHQNPRLEKRTNNDVRDPHLDPAR